MFVRDEVRFSRYCNIGCTVTVTMRMVIFSFFVCVLFKRNNTLIVLRRAVVGCDHGRWVKLSVVAYQ